MKQKKPTKEEVLQKIRNDKNASLTVPEAAALLNAHEHTVRKMIKDGKLEAFNTGKKWLINLLSIPAFMRK